MLHFKRGWNSLAPIFHSMFQLIFWFLFFVWDPGRGYWPWTELGRKRIYLCTLNTHCSETAQIAQTLNKHCTHTVLKLHKLHKHWTHTVLKLHKLSLSRLSEFAIQRRQTNFVGHILETCLEQMSFDQFILIDSNHFTDHCPFQNNTLL